MATANVTPLFPAEQVKKRCTKCHKEKLRSEFHRQGKHPWCPSCVSAYDADYKTRLAQDTERSGQIRKDVTGHDFHMLHVLRMFRKGGTTYAECECACGVVCTKRMSEILGGAQSCGCLRKRRRVQIIIRDGIEYKWCASCKKEQVLSDFRKDSKQRSGYFPYCNRAMADRAACYAEDHPEEARLAKQRSTKADPQRYRRIQRVGQARRRARKRNLPDTFTSRDEVFALQYWHYACAVCGAERGLYNDIVMDHWIPIASADCPGTVPGNMLPLCQALKGCPIDHPACNSRKTSKEPLAWLATKLGARAAQTKLKKIEVFFSAARQFAASEAV